MVDVSFMFWIDSDPPLNAREAYPSALPDSKNTAQLNWDHQLAFRRNHTFQLFHVLHLNTKSKTATGGRAMQESQYRMFELGPRTTPWFQAVGLSQIVVPLDWLVTTLLFNNIAL